MSRQNLDEPNIERKLGIKSYSLSDNTGNLTGDMVQF